MKLKHCLTLTISLLTALTVAAQNTAAPTNAPAPETPAPAAPAPAVAPPPAVAPEKPAEASAAEKPAATKPARKKSAKAKTAAAKTPAKKASANIVKFDPPVSATVKQENVNVRGRASFIGEVITHLKKGESVTVLEEITLGKPKKDEPPKWNKILMPTNTPVWVSAEFVDPNSKAALKRIHVRGGPGENFSSLNILEKGTVVKDLRKQNDWLEIETPANTVGFVAADLLDKQATPAVATAAPETNAPAPAPEVVNVTSDTNAPAATVTDVATTPPPATEPAPAATNATPVVAPTPEPAKEEPPPKRVVTREGVVKKARNIQAPADFELHDARTSELIDYLTAEQPDKDLKPYVGAKVVITGEEAMDARWPRTPMLKVETIELP